MCTIKKVKHSELKTFIGKMKENAKNAKNDATKQMIEAFDEEISNCAYFIAQDKDKFGLMSITAPPIIKIGEKDQKENPQIDNSVWVEGLVADAKSGLGSKLLLEAERYALEKGKAYVSLAAYEYDQNPINTFFITKPYSVAKYYAERCGFKYTGEGYVEHDENKTLTYPIYSKEIPKLKPKL